MVKFSDEELVAHAERVRGRVLLITGGGSGIGKGTSLFFAQHGAKVVIGDINGESAAATAQEINAKGGQSVSMRCDVTVWDDQVALFELAKASFGDIDIVIPNAGIGPREHLEIQEIDGKLQPPKLTLIDVNLIGVLYTTSLAFHYFGDGGEGTSHDRLKAIVFISSLSAIIPFPVGGLYAASKAAVFALQENFSRFCQKRRIRSGAVCPAYTDTALLQSLRLKRNTEFVPINRIASVCVAIATNPSRETSGHPWIILNGREAHCLQDHKQNVLLEMHEGYQRPLSRL